MGKKCRNATIVLIVLVAIIIVVVLLWRYGRDMNEVVTQGVVECRTYRASSKLAGRIDSMFVREGDWVEYGELLYTISTPELDAKLEQVSALESAAQALNREVDMGVRRQQIVALRNMWQKTVAGLDLAKKSYERVRNLYERGVVPRQQYDEALANYNAMQATMNAAKAEYDMAVEGATKEQREAVAAKVREAQGAVDEVNSYLRDARVYAPVAGRVSDIVSEPGELVGSGYPVVTILDLSNMWATFNIKEDNLKGLDVGARFSAYIPALDEYAQFEVFYIASEADFATWSATRARGGFDIRTFEVKARQYGEAVGLLPGMSVVVKQSFDNL